MEKRKHQRIRTMKRIKAIISNAELEALLHDISGGGAALGIEYVAYPNDKIKVKLDGLGEILGEVVRPTENGLAVRFVDVSVELEKSLKLYIDNLDGMDG